MTPEPTLGGAPLQKDVVAMGLGREMDAGLVAPKRSSVMKSAQSVYDAFD
jgi:hypothetical protein